MGGFSQEHMGVRENFGACVLNILSLPLAAAKEEFELSMKKYF